MFLNFLLPVCRWYAWWVSSGYFLVDSESTKLPFVKVSAIYARSLFNILHILTSLWFFQQRANQLSHFFSGSATSKCDRNSSHRPCTYIHCRGSHIFFVRKTDLYDIKNKMVWFYFCFIIGLILLAIPMQDAMIRWRRMSGYNALWIPGGDHGGLTTQVCM